MTPTAQEVAEDIINEILLHYEIDSPAKMLCLKRIAAALTTFAHARERAVWEQAIAMMDETFIVHITQDAGTTWGEQKAAIQREFRRRSTGVGHG